MIARGSAPCRMLKMATVLTHPAPARQDAPFRRQGRRELGDRSVPLGYVAGRRATENDAGGHVEHPVRGISL